MARPWSLAGPCGTQWATRWEAHCVTVLRDRTWSRGGGVILVWLLPRLMACRWAHPNQDAWKIACNPCNDAGNPAERARRHCLVKTGMNSEHEGWQECGKVKLTELLVLCYSLWVLYKKRDSIFVHRNGFWLHFCCTTLIWYYCSSIPEILLLFNFILLSVATSFLPSHNLLVYGLFWMFHPRTHPPSCWV